MTLTTNPLIGLFIASASMFLVIMLLSAVLRLSDNRYLKYLVFILEALFVVSLLRVHAFTLDLVTIVALFASSMAAYFIGTRLGDYLSDKRMYALNNINFLLFVGINILLAGVIYTVLLLQIQQGFVLRAWPYVWALIVSLIAEVNSVSFFIGGIIITLLGVASYIAFKEGKLTITPFYTFFNLLLVIGFLYTLLLVSARVVYIYREISARTQNVTEETAVDQIPAIGYLARLVKKDSEILEKKALSFHTTLSYGLYSTGILGSVFILGNRLMSSSIPQKSARAQRKSARRASRKRR